MNQFDISEPTGKPGRPELYPETAYAMEMRFAAAEMAQSETGRTGEHAWVDVVVPAATRPAWMPQGTLGWLICQGEAFGIEWQPATRRINLNSDTGTDYWNARPEQTGLEPLGLRMLCLAWATPEGRAVKVFEWRGPALLRAVWVRLGGGFVSVS